MFLIYVTLNTFLLKLTELADRTYKGIFKKRYREQRIIVLEKGLENILNIAYIMKFGP